MESAGARGQVTPLSPMRRAVARQVVRSATTIPHIHVGHAAVVDELVRRVNASGGRLSLTAVLVHAVGLVLPKHPLLLSRFADDGLERVSDISVGLVVATEDGLLIPKVKDVDRAHPAELTSRIADLVQRARNRKLMDAEMEGCPFNISNLGMFGVRWFTALVPPGETAILAVGAVREEPVARDGQVRVGHVMELVLGVDHRVVDGAQASAFLTELVNILEVPELWLRVDAEP